MRNVMNHDIDVRFDGAADWKENLATMNIVILRHVELLCANLPLITC